MTAKFGDFAGPINEAATVTPSDTTVLGDINGFRCLYVGVAGDLVVTLAGPGNTLMTFPNAPVGWHPINGIKVMAATAASGIVAGW
jgi:hypothetical protein